MVEGSEGDRGKKVKIAIIVVCFVAAAIIFAKQFSGGPGGPKGNTWMKCNNPACNAEYEMSRKAYQEYQTKTPGRFTGRMYLPSPMVCEECNEKSLYQAMKCQKCNTVFIIKINDPSGDKCPSCGYSPSEEIQRNPAR